jgi:hypothetical protein
VGAGGGEVGGASITLGVAGSLGTSSSSAARRVGASAMGSTVAGSLGTSGSAARRVGASAMGSTVGLMGIAQGLVVALLSHWTVVAARTGGSVVSPPRCLVSAVACRSAGPLRPCWYACAA